jgi:hypothetical protein
VTDQPFIIHQTLLLTPYFLVFQLVTLSAQPANLIAGEFCLDRRCNLVDAATRKWNALCVPAHEVKVIEIKGTRHGHGLLALGVL